MDTMAFENFDEIDMNHLAGIEGGFDVKGVAASYLAMGTAALGGLACTTPVGAALYLGAEVCAGAAAIYYGAN
ncbi:Blp family class II bacteriocin [Streptococcus mutans]|uniref:Blp family class II bacteriocin n=1 Tax=Streptococcus mutans TaxID=1309 RepID=UPI000516F294|nr:Blp family class II bacteriocin [Streptococcus mutans]